MDPISLTALVAGVGLVSAWADRRWQARRGRNSESPLQAPLQAAEAVLEKTTSQAQALGSQAAERVKNLGAQAQNSVQSLGGQAGEQAKSLGSQAASAAQALQERIPFGRSGEALSPLFREWVAGAAAGEPELANWLASLSDNQFAEFTDSVKEFGDSIGVDLALLVRGELKPMPDLEKNATASVVNYCRSCRQAAAAQSDLELFRAYREYTEKPGSRKGRAYGQKLLDRLLEAGLTTVSLSDFLGAAPKARDEQMVQAIRAAAEKDPAAFSRVLKSLADDDAGQAPSAGANPSPAPA